MKVHNDGRKVYMAGRESIKGWKREDIRLGGGKYIWREGKHVKLDGKV